MPKAITASQLLSMIEKQGYRCAITGRELTPETASLDHIVPLAKGGDHAIENLWVVHCQVNTAKNTLSFDEFVTLCREVVEWTDKRLSGPS